MKKIGKNLYIHIGMIKTGSSFIQKFLYEKRDKLNSLGYCYPCPFNPLEKKHVVFGNIAEMISTPFSNKINTIEEQKKYWEEKIEPIIEHSNAKNVIATSEWLIDSDIEKHSYIFSSDMKEKFENVKIIAYLKKPAEFIASIYSQYAKTTLLDTATLNDYLNYNIISYRNIFNFIDRYSKDNVIIRPFEKEQWKNNDIIEDFLSCLGIEEKIEFNDSDKVNSSIDYDSCVISRLKNEFKIPYEKSLDLTMEIFEARRTNRKIIDMISDEDILKITEKYKPDIDAIAKLYGKDKFFLNIFPKEYGKPKENSDEIIVTPHQIEILKRVIKENVSAYKKQIDELQSVKHFEIGKFYNEKNHRVLNILGIKFKFRN